MSRIEEQTVDVYGVATFYRRADGTGAPTLFVHGNPSHSGDWTPFLERVRGPAAADAGLDELSCPALVVWGQRDAYLGPEQGRRYAERLPNAQLLEVRDGGHWPWIDDPSVIEQVVEFLDRGY
jgi:pimeloyl-ACP methyl ester carboxylesterase